MTNLSGITSYSVDPAVVETTTYSCTSLDYGSQPCSGTFDGGSNCCLQFVVQYAAQSSTGSDFSVAANPASLTITPTSSASSQITISSLNMFSGTLQVSTIYTYNQLSVQGVPSMVTLTSTGAGATSAFMLTVSVATGGTIIPGRYIVTVKAMNATVTRYVYVPVTLSNPRETLTEPACVPQSVVTGSPTTCTVTTASIVGTGLPTGTVTVSSNGPGVFSPQSGSCTLTPITPTAINIATCTVTYTPSGGTTQTINASYPGDSNHDPSQGASAISIGIARVPTTARVQCSPGSFSVGSKIDCLVTIIGSSPSGTVAFGLVGSNGGATAPTAATCTLANNQCAVFVLGLSPGMVIVGVVYSGDSNNLPSTSSTSLTLSSPANAVASNGDLSSMSAGKASSDQSSTTGIAISIFGSSAADGTMVSIVTQKLNGPTMGIGTASLDNAVYYDILVSGISDGHTNICITDQSASSVTTMRYWNGSGWNGATGVSVSGTKVCGGIQVSYLTGTEVAVGNPVQQSSLPLMTIALVAIVVVVAIVVAIVALRARGGKRTQEGKSV